MKNKWILFPMIALILGCATSRSRMLSRIEQFEPYKSAGSVRESIGEPDKVELLGESQGIAFIKGAVFRFTYGRYWLYFDDNKFIYHSDSMRPHQEADDFLKMGLIEKEEYYRRREVEALEAASRAIRQSAYTSMGSQTTRTSCSPNISGGFDCTTR